MRERIFLLFFVLSFVYPLSIEEKGGFRGLASSWNIIPSRSMAGLHYIFKGYSYDDDESSVKVTGPVIEITNGQTLGAKVFQDGFSTEMDPEDFEEEQILAQSIFEARTADGSSVGTAFLVGRRFVFTNRHVMGVLPKTKRWSCGRFSIKLNHKEERVDCEEVVFCSKKYDYCVVEMKNMANGIPLGVELRPLRLARKVKADKDANLLHIGNAAGLGLQASVGKGLRLKNGEFYHFAPTLGGSSGAPIFNERREVIGINWGHTGENYIGEAAFNRGVLIETIFEELKTLRPEVLKDIKSFHAWNRRLKTHRQVRIEPRD
jgi:hypothetical protein